MLEAPERDIRRLRTALRGFRGIELRDAAEVLGGDLPLWAPEPARRSVRVEMVPARPVSEPLARPSLDPDPLTPFAALAGVRRDRGEEAAVCVDLLPVLGFRAGRLRRRIRRQARRASPGGGATLEEVLGSGRGRGRRSDPVELYERRALGKGLEARLREGATLFEVQILIRVDAGEAGRAERVLNGLRDAFAPSVDRNHLRVRGQSLAGLAFLGSDLPGRRGRFDRRYGSGLFRPARRETW